ncbi:MAG: alginate lyase family protein, partial [Pyrinomonadaceae bacterium]
MKNLIQKALTLSGLFFCLLASVYGQKAPATLALNGDRLLANRSNVANDPALKASLSELTRQADKIVKTGKLYSVMDKEQVPPSGDKHDYMSQAPYWWPDPSKKDGLPYIKKDGQRNPELNKISDTGEMDDVIGESEKLSLAYYFTGDEKYAAHAGAVIRAWFLDPKTRQNPNLNYSQGVRGINKGRGIGLIETRQLYRVIDSAILLQGSKSWTAADQDSLKKWFADFVKWMVESPIGKEEAVAKNNHGTHYDVQVIAYAEFAGQSDLAKKELEVTKQRIKSQIATDGQLPLEEARTLSWNYVNMCLNGFLTIARLAENVNVDLWNYETSDGRGI